MENPNKLTTDCLRGIVFFLFADEVQRLAMCSPKMQQRIAACRTSRFRLKPEQKISLALMRAIPKCTTALTIRVAKDKVPTNGLEEYLQYLPKGLETLIVPNACAKLSDEHICLLPRNLTVLDVSYGTLITDAAIKDLPRSLIDFNLAIHHSLTDASIKDLPRTLIRLDLSINRLLTDASMKDLPRNLICTREILFYWVGMFTRLPTTWALTNHNSSYRRATTKC